MTDALFALWKSSWLFRMCEPGDYNIGFLHVLTDLQLFLWANLPVANLHVCAQHGATRPQCVSVEGVIQQYAIGKPCVSVATAFGIIAWVAG